MVRLMKIEVSGKQFVFPRLCACCDRFPNKSIMLTGTERNRYSRTRGWAWDVPYCQACLRHVRQSDGILIGALSIVSLFGFCSLFGVLAGLSLWLVITGFVLALSGAGFLTWLALRSLAKFGNPSCATIRLAIRYLGSSGATHSFDFSSRPYATAFVRANRLKLVNASTTVSQIVRDSGFREIQVARRITRRLR